MPKNIIVNLNLIDLYHKTKPKINIIIYVYYIFWVRVKNMETIGLKKTIIIVRNEAKESFNYLNDLVLV